MAPSGHAHALAAFHHAVAKGDLEKVKEFVQGGEKKAGKHRIAVNMQDEDGLAAVHWAAIKGHKEVLKFLIDGAPENNRADPSVVDRDNWSPLMWAIFMAESAGKEIGKRKSQCDVVNFLMSHSQLKPEMEDQLNKADRLLHRTPKEMAYDLARGTDEAIVQATMGKWDPHRTYGPLKDDAEVPARPAAPRGA